MAKRNELVERRITLRRRFFDWMFQNFGPKKIGKIPFQNVFEKIGKIPFEALCYLKNLEINSSKYIQFTQYRI